MIPHSVLGHWEAVEGDKWLCIVRWRFRTMYVLIGRRFDVIGDICSLAITPYSVKAHPGYFWVKNDETSSINDPTHCDC